MNDKIICKKVSAMLSVYIDNKVNYQERAFIEEHLANCESCYKKYLYLKSLIKSLKDSYKQILELSMKKQQRETFSIKEHEQFLSNLSPYVDNELDAQDCYEFRKYLLKSKTAQNELKKTYHMQKELRESFNKIKKKAGYGMSIRVMNSLRKTSAKNNDVFPSNFFSVKFVKVAILASLVLLGGYEILQTYNFDNLAKQESTNQEVTSEDLNKAQISENDFVEF